MFYVVDSESSCCVDFLLHWDPDSLLCPGMKVDWHFVMRHFLNLVGTL